VTALVFMDTETTGLSLDDDIWEFAAIRRESDGRESEHHFYLTHDVSRCEALPEPFRKDHQSRYDHTLALTPPTAARRIATLFEDRPHVVGAVPNFDTERLGFLLRRNGFEPGWHYHLCDVENLAVGFLAGVCRLGGAAVDGSSSWLTGPPKPPWDSDSLSRACGVEPPTTERHTAMGDARWAMALYDAITARAS
jgi:hypothetical protein